MIGYLGNLLSTYLLGLLVPLGAVCVLPLYPGFIAFLSKRLSQMNRRGGSIILGLIVTAGVITFMAIIGVVFSTFLRVSLTKVISIVSPIAFGVLAVISILLIFHIDMGRLFRSVRVPQTKNPVPGAFLFGFFRRDYGAARLFDVHSAGAVSGVPLVVAMVTITLFIPCIAQFLVMQKERGLRTALAVAGCILPFAFGVGALLNLILTALEVQI